MLLNLPAEDAWCTRKPGSEEEKLNQYIQVDFLLKTRVIQVGTMRRKSKDHWVSEYYLKYSDDDVNWIEYQENGHKRVSDDHQIIGLLLNLWINTSRLLRISGSKAVLSYCAL